MFSGKTEELIRRLKRARYAGQRLQVFKPKIDNRYDDESIVSHDSKALPSFPVSDVDEMRDTLEPHVEVVGIDEVQFFGEEVIEFCNELADMECRVIVAGLDQDYRNKPFGPMPHLLCLAEYLTKLNAICVRCGNPAHRSYRLASDPQQVLVGSGEQYEARCRRCFRQGYPASENDTDTEGEPA